MDPSYSMHEKEFLELYNSHRSSSNEGKVKWNREHCLSTCNEFGLQIMVETITLPSGKTTTQRMIHGIRKLDVDADN